MTPFFLIVTFKTMMQWLYRMVFLCIRATSIVFNSNDVLVYGNARRILFGDVRSILSHTTYD